MNNTKTIFKSLLIMIVAISLFTVSCSKDEGGTKKPTNPTIEKISADQITGVLKGVGKLNDTDTSKTLILDFTTMTEPANGNATITKGANESKSLQKVKDAISEISQHAPIVSVAVTFGNGPAANNNTDLVATIVFTAKSGFEFDTTITGGTKYTYNKDAKTATLTLNIKLPQSTNWEA